MGPRGAAVPRDVVRVRVDPFVTSIPASAFRERKKLAEVELCEGLVEIGVSSSLCYDCASEEYQLKQQSALWLEPQLEHLFSL